MNKEYTNLDNKDRDLTSDFNEAKLQIMRIGDYLLNCGRFASSGNLDKWNWELDKIWRELSRDAELADEGKTEGTYNRKIAQLKDLVAKYRAIPDKLYKILAKKEIVLRRLQDESGKGSRRSSEEEEDDIDQ